MFFLFSFQIIIPRHVYVLTCRPYPRRARRFITMEMSSLASRHNLTLLHCIRPLPHAHVRLMSGDHSYQRQHVEVIELGKRLLTKIFLIRRNTSKITNVHTNVIIRMIIGNLQ